MQTHSVASVNADVLTSKGWTTFSSRISVIVPCVGIKPVSANDSANENADVPGER